MSNDPAISKPLDTYDMKMLTGRLYDPGYKLKDAGKVVMFHLGGTAYHAIVHDKGEKNVLFRDRGNGIFEVTCDCTEKPMGCKHCVATIMQHLGFRKGRESEQHILERIEEVSEISTNYGDYEPTLAQRRYPDWQFIDQCVVKPAFTAISCAIDENSKDEETRIGMYRMLMDLCKEKYDGHTSTLLCDLVLGHGIQLYDED